MKGWDWIPSCSFFECWVLSQLFHSPLSPSSRSSLVLLCFQPLGWYHLHIWSCYFSWESWFQLVSHPMWLSPRLWQYTALSESFPNFEPAPCSISGSDYCFFSCIQFSQEPSRVVWYSHLLKPGVLQSIGPKRVRFNWVWTEHSQRLQCSRWSRCFSGILLLFLLSSGCWQFDLWFSAFSKPSLYMWKFLVHVLLKTSLKDFEHYLANMKWVQSFSSLNIFWSG